MKIIQLVCEQCGITYDVDAHHMRKNRRFCSIRCGKTFNPLVLLLRQAKIQENGCWNFTGTIDEGGYGQIKCGKIRTTAHRLMWMTWNDQTLPDDIVVRHTCIGNRRCINPDHLTPGTQKQNIQDCIDQGRFVILRGSEKPKAKLTEEIVLEIRRLRNPQDGSKPISYYKLAKRFGASYTAIWYADHGVQWAHVK